MPDRTEQDPRAEFVRSLSRKSAELKSVLATLVADPRGKKPRDELRRRLYALSTSSRSHALPTVSDAIKRATDLLDARSKAVTLERADLDVLGELIAQLPADGQRDLDPVTAASPVPLAVLIVGSDALLLDVQDALAPETDVSHVGTVAEALATARDNTPDVVVCEAVAEGGARGLLAAFRNDPSLADLPVVVLVPGGGTAVGPDEVRGATAVVLRPTSPGRVRDAIERAGRVPEKTTLPPPAFGEVTLEELTRTLQEEIRRGILGGANGGSERVPLGPGAEVLAATWEAIARVRDVVERKSQGRVRFELPAAPLGPGGAHVLALGADEAVDPEAASGDDPLPGRRALVVDDDAGVVGFFATLLREAGMEVTECGDGQQALDQARAVRPDVVIADILMPGIDGFTLCRAIRRDVALRHTPVILLSWKEDLLHRMRELGAGAAGYLRKESHREAILGRVRSVVRPRVRLLRRIERLGEGAEVRSRIERIGMFALLGAIARSKFDVRLTVGDAFSLTELEVRDARLVSVIRTSQDGSLARGERALLPVLGVASARFSLRRSDTAVRANVQRPLDEILANAATHIMALEECMGAPALAEIAALELDDEATRVFAATFPAPMRALAERLLAGAAPRELVMRQSVPARELEPVLLELVRRGAVRAARDADGGDLVEARTVALRNGPRPMLATESLLDLARSVTGSRPSPAPSARGPIPNTPESKRPAFAAITQPQLVEAAPLEAPEPAQATQPTTPSAITSSEPFEAAVLRELRADRDDVRPRQTDPDLDDGPELESEPAPPNDEPPPPRLTASPQRSARPPGLAFDESEEEGMTGELATALEFDDASTAGAPMLVAPTPSPRAGLQPSTTEDTSAAHDDHPRSEADEPGLQAVRAHSSGRGYGRLLLAVIALGAVSYGVVFAYLRVRDARAPAAVVADRTDVAPPPVAPPVPPAPSVAHVDAAPPRVLAGDDPAPLLGGQVLAPGRALLAVDGQGEVIVNQQPAGPAPVRLQLAPGSHTVTWRRGGDEGFWTVTLVEGRAVRRAIPEAIAGDARPL